MGSGMNAADTLFQRLSEKEMIFFVISFFSCFRDGKILKKRLLWIRTSDLRLLLPARRLLPQGVEDQPEKTAVG